MRYIFCLKNLLQDDTKNILLDIENKEVDIKKGEPLYSIYSQEILSIQNELQVAKNFNQNIYQSSTAGYYVCAFIRARRLSEIRAIISSL